MLLGNAPMLKTGYSTQLYMMGQFLKEQGFAVAHVCDYGYAGNMFVFDGVEVYGCDEYPGTLTSTTLKKHVLDWKKRNRVSRWCLIGLGNLHSWGELVATVRNSLLIAPVDGDSLKPEDLPALHSATRVAGMTPHGVEVLTESGFENPLYIPHGFDSKLATGRSHRAVRATATFQHATDCFLVGFLGDMSVRKAPRENLQAFVKFAEDKPDVRLWLKGSNHPQQSDVSRFLHNLYGKVISTDSYDNDRGLTTDEMRDLLVSLDVLLHCSSQEGFGIYQIEAQAVGTPVITTGHGSTKHLNANPDLVVLPTNHRTASGVNHHLPNPEEITVRLEALYQEWKTGDISKRTPVCLKWAEDWSFPAVSKHLLSAVHQMLDESREVNQDQPELNLHPPVKRKKVAILSTYETTCGIATYTRWLAESLKSQGEDVVVLAEATDSEPIGSFELGLEIPYIRCWDRKYDVGGALHSALEQLKPDVVHVQHEWALFRNAREIWEVLRESRCKVVFTYHTPDFVSDQHEGAISHLMAHSSFADGIITHNPFVSSAIRGKVFPPVSHIPHGIRALPQLSGARGETSVPDGVPLILNYGFASESKGTLDLIRALEIVKRGNRCPYFECVIYAGDHPHWDVDPYLAECEKVASRVSGLSFIREFVSDDKLDLMLNASDFVCFPYSGVPGHEILSTSGAVMRSLGAGKPIICTDEGRLRDLIGGVHAIKSAKNSPASLAKAIETSIHMFHNSRKTYGYMANEVLALAGQNSWPAVAHRHQQVYDRVCSVYSVRPDRVMPVKPVWTQIDAKDMLDYETVQSSQGDEEE